ncbi:PREDICTED: CLAVATA3/ESR (CLE)-related protein 25-like [Brassica oleracea var. oleracea]|uniref:CLAVATA3/ESR (CLE)-related protein 25-like n=1 Tax=Brassica oleracea var. oleracea TaxID=109376 RepID=UPI0006A6CA8D|nr:PREDICTED: CLAVATA3/ESR (CLE)-related protein 25-like [Brassica oleracea var. oleracea]XP_013619356.1 PREDICTED: CLAVATA3/ESR (CLE)-related protein 25-like [Brassica oleracea var. oleracea]
MYDAALRPSFLNRPNHGSVFPSCRDIRCSMGGSGISALVRAVVSLIIIVFLLVGILANAGPSVPSTEKVKSLRFSGKDVNLFHVSKRKVPNGADPIHNRKETSRRPPRV